VDIDKALANLSSDNCLFEVLISEHGHKVITEVHNKGAESNTKLAREKQEALCVAIHLPKKNLTHICHSQQWRGFRESLATTNLVV